MRPFLLLWNIGQTSVYQQGLLDYLDTRIEVRNYYVPFLGTILIVADQNQTPSTLKELVHRRFPDLLFAVVPADQWSTNGWMPQVFWDLIQNPWASGRWDKPAPGSLGALLAGLTSKKE